jgi:catechol-2,3-dioxygenase
VLGFTTVVGDDDWRFAFMRAPASENHHDIAFFSIGSDVAASTAGQSSVGLYHLAWQVATIEELATMRERLQAAGALVGASDHGASKSLYAVDPDGLVGKLIDWRNRWNPQ